MAITNFIPTVWSENLLTALDQSYIGVANCNRDYEGDIKTMGSTVKICGVGDVTIGDYAKNTDMSTPQTLDDSLAELVIDRAKYFNFQIDDIDKAQCTPKLMEAAMKNAAMALSKEADQYIYSLYTEASKSLLSMNNISASISDLLFMAREMLYKNGVINSDDVVIELTPRAATEFLKNQAKTLSYNNPIFETGFIGTFAGCKVFVSNNVCYETGSMEEHHCLVRSKRAIAFAEQISEVEAYRPEKRFADAVKGLHLYGAKVVYPQELIHVQFSFSEYSE